MEKITISDWDMAENINTKEDVIMYLKEALKENDIEFLFEVIGDIVRSKGMAEITKDLNTNGENPSFGTIVKVLDNLGFQLSIKQKVPA